MKNEYLYPASPLSMSSAILNGKTFVDVTGAFNKYAYALSELMKVTEGQVLITGISNSIHMTGFTDKHGNTEKEQGTWLVTMLRSVDNAGFIGGVIYDLNDNWTDVSDDHRAFAVPQEADKLWHDVTDPQ